MKFNEFLLLGLWISNALVGLQAAQQQNTSNENFAAEGPEIIPHQERIDLNVTSLITVSCKDKVPITWKYPEGSKAMQMMLRFKNQPHIYGEQLTLWHAGYKTTGNYYCVRKKDLTKDIALTEEPELTDLVNNNKASMIYIFAEVEPKTENTTSVSTENVAEVPVIIPTRKRIEIKASILVTIYCMDTEPIAWKYPLRSKALEMSYFPKEKERRHGKQLTLWNTDYYTTGNYYCLRTKNFTKKVSLMDDTELVDLVTQNKASTIYIFVDAEIPITTVENSTKPTEPTTANNTSTSNEKVEIIPVPAGLAGVPLIIPTQNRVELKPYTSRYTLNCKDTERIAWKYPNESNAIETSYLPREKERLFGRLLNMWSIDYYTMGYYYCVRTKDLTKNLSLMEDSELRDLVMNNTASAIYVFVDVRKPLIRVTHRVELLPADEISSTSQHYATEGGNFSLKCSFLKVTGGDYRLRWILPTGQHWNQSRMFEEHKIYRTKPISSDNSSSSTQFYTTITITEAIQDDSGEYICNIWDESVDNSATNNTYQMWVVREEKYYIEIIERNNVYEINEKFNKTVLINVRFSGYPWPTLKWYNPKGDEISNNEKFEITNENITSSTLKISNTHLWDSGTYAVEATNPFKTGRRHFNITIEDVPIVDVADVQVQVTDKAHVQCKVQSRVKAVVNWTFESCSIKPKWPSCSGEFITDFNETSSSNGNSTMEFIYDLYFIPISSGRIRCSVENKIGTTIGESLVLIRDINDNMTIYGISDNDIIALDDKVTITCAALGNYYTADINWFDENGLQITENEDISLSVSSSPYSFRKALTFNKIKSSNQGRYECRARTIKDETTESRVINITTHEPLAPRMTYTNLGDDNEMKHELGETIELKCESESIPKATVNWYKEDILIPNNGSILSISYLKPEDEGQYKCIVTNRLGSIEKSVKIKITNLPVLSTTAITLIVLIFIAAIILVILLYVRVKRARKSLGELKAAGLENFENGDLEHLNPTLTLNEQADLLPYDRCFEFPRDKLKLGKQLGSGAFGVVLKAQALGIAHEEKETTVAVKMVKRQATNDVMKALVSELKIMVHLGKHLNVVNLLGAVTRNIAKRELMVIVEYCPYGNIRSFLMGNKKRFINQINPSTDNIESTVMIENCSDNLEMNSSPCNTCSNSSGYVTQSETSGGLKNEYTIDQTLKRTIIEDGVKNVISKTTDSADSMAVTTTDLVSWAFQISFGMEYLSSKNVLHGDLAARNILLCDDNIVKICDFGLSRSMYESDYYRKQGDALLPVKWLALESLSDRVFSTSTDIWSFGIVLWEIFSMGKVPYPEINANQGLYLKLKDGYRMEKPLYANDYLYDIMLQCWSANPETRPSFSVLKEKFAVILGEEITNRYIHLNDPFVKENREYSKKGQADISTGSSEEMTPQQPRYISILPKATTIADNPTTDPDDDAMMDSPTDLNESSKVLKNHEGNTDQLSNNSSIVYGEDKSCSRKNKTEIETPTEESPMLKDTKQ